MLVADVTSRHQPRRTLSHTLAILAAVVCTTVTITTIFQIPSGKPSAANAVHSMAMLRVVY
jgi:hypothetical protein